MEGLLSSIKQEEEAQQLLTTKLTITLNGNQTTITNGRVATKDRTHRLEEARRATSHLAQIIGSRA